MSNQLKSQPVIEFGPFRYNPASGELFKENQKLATLKPKVGKTLEVLLERRGDVVDKEWLLKAIWPDSVVEESNLTHNIWELRQLLGSDLIETIPRRGFRLQVPEAPARSRRLTLNPKTVAVGLVAIAAGLVILWTLRAARTGRNATAATGDVFYVYRDAASPDNHFYPTGRMGDCGDIELDEAWSQNPYSGSTAVRVTYTPKGLGPNTCSYPAPCRWAGLYWQHPPDNWGTEAKWEGEGYNLSGFTRLRFRARADRPTTLEFKVGGINGPYGDSLRQPRSTLARLDANWREFEIDLTGADLRHIIGGFCWVTNWAANPQPITFYLDEIRFEGRSPNRRPPRPAEAGVVSPPFSDGPFGGRPPARSGAWGLRRTSG